MFAKTLEVTPAVRSAVEGAVSDVFEGGGAAAGSGGATETEKVVIAVMCGLCALLPGNKVGPYLGVWKANVIQALSNPKEVEAVRVTLNV